MRVVCEVAAHKLFVFLIILQVYSVFAKIEGLSPQSTLSPAVCLARTVNYITHTLPQQCLPSSRSPSNNFISVELSIIAPTATSPSIPSVSSAETSETASRPLCAFTSIKSTSETADVPIEESSIEAHYVATPLSESIEADGDQDLENSKFLSFEEWKKQTLAKSGQSDEIVRRRPSDNSNQRRKSIPVQNTLDSIGDDAEIDLVFSGFTTETGESGSPREYSGSNGEHPDTKVADVSASEKAKLRSKDAGTTCKERFNYASFDCAATVLKTNTQAKGSGAVLNENKDYYMLNECSADDKFLILELCSDISIDTIVLANFEFFSSIFRTFRVSVSDRYPVKLDKWKTLGTFEARNSREVQAFLVENPLIWARYVRIEFLTHYGNEYYCPVSLVRVHGTTMMEDYKADLESIKADDEVDGNGEGEAQDEEEGLIPEAIAEVILQENAERKEQEESAATAASEAVEAELEETPRETTDVVLNADYSATVAQSSAFGASFNQTTPVTTVFDTPSETCGLVEIDTGEDGDARASTNSLPSSVPPSEFDVFRLESPGPETPAPLANDLDSSTPDKNSSAAINDSSIAKGPGDHGQPSASDSQLSSASSTTIPMSETPKRLASSTQPAPANPTIQESFFKSVQKRLQMLESNSSLSLQYIEEQSRHLRAAFTKVEQRQLNKTTTFLAYLNTTVLSELRDFRQQYDQLWQSTVLELESQREQYQRELVTLNARLALHADELVFQKRMAVLQSILILLCLGLVLFSRTAINAYLDRPRGGATKLVRSASMRLLTGAGSATPSSSPSPIPSPGDTRPSSSSAYRPHPSPAVLQHGPLRGHASEDDAVEVDAPSSPPAAAAPSVSNSPSPPISCDARSDNTDDDDDDDDDDDNAAARLPTGADMPRPTSSPPVRATPLLPVLVDGGGGEGGRGGGGTTA